MTRTVNAPARRTAATILTVALAAVLATGFAVANAGEAHADGSGEGICFKAWNYRAGGFLYAATEGQAHPAGGTCTYVWVEIGHGSHYRFPTGPGIEGSRCLNAMMLDWRSSNTGYVSLATPEPPEAWKPCSDHRAAESRFGTDSFGALLF